ncbi:polysaccharide biosynthesis C-terminal domain-containing protein [Acidobacteria bacterium AH-259-G07]|nr:polysaccharide biosynthesis C-terminal domain-containing protein [Acidobacteria bacterium AH-259-G07]
MKRRRKVSAAATGSAASNLSVSPIAGMSLLVRHSDNLDVRREAINQVPVVTGIAMVVNIAVNLVLIPRMGSEGAALSVIVTEVVLAVGYAVAVWKYLARETREIIPRNARKTI